MSLMKKLSIILVCLIVFSFAVPCQVRAEADWGGKLIAPIVDLVVYLGDGVLDIVHNTLIGQETSTIRLDLTSSTGETILKWLGAIAAAVIAVVLTVVTWGAAAAAFAAIRSYYGCGISRNCNYGCISWRSCRLYACI